MPVQGKAYLAGPYKNAPLSLAVITPAIAGPFDLGTVVVRVALYVDQNTSQIHAVSDPLPTILDGIPLDVRSVSLSMDRSGFTFNPTSCEAMSVDRGSDLDPRPERCAVEPFPGRWLSGIAVQTRDDDQHTGQNEQSQWCEPHGQGRPEAG